MHGGALVVAHPYGASVTGFFTRLGKLLMNWQSAVERTVAGLGYDLVDAEKGVTGLLRVLIDHLPASGDAGVDAVAASASAAERFITVDDCEKVTRQLQHVLEVEGCAYERLEVSSPGLDRPLKKAADYARFVGEQVEVTLKLPFQGRKKYRGELQAQGEGWRIVLSDTKVLTKSEKAAAKNRKPVEAGATGGPSDLALDFSLDEVRDAHLVPIVDFKGQRFASHADAIAPEIEPAAGVRSDDEIDGGRIQ